MANKLSFSQVKMYSECGQKYKYHYVDGYREKRFASALMFGSAIDNGLNTLLIKKDLKEAYQSFTETMQKQWVNGSMTELHKSNLISYSKNDFDEELLTVQDVELLKQEMVKRKLDTNFSVFETFNKITEIVADKGIEELTEGESYYYCLANWLCLCRKGIIMIDSYNEKIMPQIQEVLAVQHKFKLVNDVGDEIVAVADLIVKWFDGRVLLLDNKTAARNYEDDQAGRSQQLIIYYHCLKEEFNLEGIGFIVINKSINKNRTKVCSECGFNGSGNRSRTCPEEKPNPEKPGKFIRCNGMWLEHLSPEAYIQTVFNEVSEAAEELVLESFDEANHGITNQMFLKNLSACKNGYMQCAFFDLCWKKNEDSIIKTRNSKK